MKALVLLLALAQVPEVPGSLDHRKQLMMISCPALDSLLVQQSAFIVRLMDRYERDCRPGMETSSVRCKTISTALIEARSDADDVEWILNKKCGGVDEP